MLDNKLLTVKTRCTHFMNANRICILFLKHHLQIQSLVKDQHTQAECLTARTTAACMQPSLVVLTRRLISLFHNVIILAAHLNVAP